MAVPVAQSVRFTCPICLTDAVLPETLPFGEDPRCALCLNILRRYLPCVECERSFDPKLPACPGCGERPPDDALTPASVFPIACWPKRWPRPVKPRCLPHSCRAGQTGGERPEAERQWEWKRPTGAQTGGYGTVVASGSAESYGNGNGASAQPASTSGASQSGPDGKSGFADGGRGARGQRRHVRRGGNPAYRGGGDHGHGVRADRRTPARLAEVVASSPACRLCPWIPNTTGLDPFADDALASGPGGYPRSRLPDRRATGRSAPAPPHS